MNYSNIEKINGKYLNLKINNQDSRIFFEENGNGIPLICLHTAGSDSRQFRHLLNSKKNIDIFSYDKLINNENMNKDNTEVSIFSDIKNFDKYLNLVLQHLWDFYFLQYD